MVSQAALTLALPTRLESEAGHDTSTHASRAAMPHHLPNDWPPRSARTWCLVAAWPRGAAAVKGVFEDKQTLSTAVSDWVANERRRKTQDLGLGHVARDDVSYLFKDKC